MHDVVEPTTDARAPGSWNIAARLVQVSSLAWDVLIVSGVSLVLGLIRLGTPPLWVDESFTADEINRSYSFYVEGYYWLYYTVERPWTLLAGTSEWALRFPSVVAAMSSCALVVVLGRRFFDRWIALIAGLLLATSPFMVRWAQQARGYTMLLALSLVALILLLRALECGTRSAWAIYGLVFAAVIVWHPVSGLLLVVPHALLAYRRRGRLIPHGLLAVAIILAFGLSWAAQLAMRSRGEDRVIAWLTYPTADVAGRALLDVSGATGIGLLVALVGLWLLIRSKEVSLSIWLGVWAFAPFALALLASLIKPVYLDRYLFVAAPAFALLGGVALMRVGRLLRPALVVGVVVATAAGLGAWYSTGEGGNWRGEDWKSAVAEAERHTDDGVVVFPWWASPAAEYYGADVVSTSTKDKIWVLMWDEREHELPPELRTPLGFGEHVLSRKEQFGWRVSAQLWTRPGAP